MCYKVEVRQYPYQKYALNGLITWNCNLNQPVITETLYHRFLLFIYYFETKKIHIHFVNVGWQALWKISRAVCESLGIKYPTIVFGIVNNVLFRELKAEFMVTRVEDDDIHIPENHEVPLEDLWPTIEQENPELNTERTADCIDQLR